MASSFYHRSSGALIYAIAGINRIRRASIASGRAPLDHDMLAHPRFDTTSELVAEKFGRRFVALKTVGDRITHHVLTTGNAIDILETGDEAYAAMAAAIDGARRTHRGPPDPERGWRSSKS